MPLCLWLSVGLAFQRLPDAAILSGDHVFIVGVSGQPEVLYSSSFKTACDSTVACRAYLNEQRRLIVALLDKVAGNERLWSVIFEAGGATVTVDPTPLTAVAPVAGLPPVAVSPLGDPVPVPADGCTRLRADQLGMLPDQAKFRDPAAAKQLLVQVATGIIARNEPATLIGTTAFPEADPVNNPLSLARARQVLEALVLGVPRSLLTAIGVGTRFSGYVPPIDAAGQRIETLAMQNRLVIIQPAGATCQG